MTGRKARGHRLMSLGIVALVVMASLGAVVYAHWEETLTVQGEVSTGSIDLQLAAGTDDDGIPGNDPSGNDVGDVNSLYDAYALGESSDDPAEMWRCNAGNCGYKLGEPGLDRYDKDVGRCVVSPAEGKQLNVTLTNTYPSYHCSTFYSVSNEGTVPVKATAFRLWTPGDVAPVGTEYVDGAAGTTAQCQTDPSLAGKCPLGVWVGGRLVITFDFADGTACGHQLDPNGAEPDSQAVWFHIEQEAEQGATYGFRWEQDFVNWNEWDASMCTIDINGTQVFP